MQRRLHQGLLAAASLALAQSALAFSAPLPPVGRSHTGMGMAGRFARLAQAGAVRRAMRSPSAGAQLPDLGWNRAAGPPLRGFGRLQMSGGAVQTGPQIYVKAFLEEEVTQALGRAFGEATAGAKPMVTAATKPEFGDYQCNAAMPLSKALKTKPRDIAEKLAKELEPSLADMFEKPEIAGPGFLNLRFKTEYISRRISHMYKDSERLGIPKVDAPQRIVVDFSSPNIAKVRVCASSYTHTCAHTRTGRRSDADSIFPLRPVLQEMHVGHLRSTIIGDTLCRLTEFRGHKGSSLSCLCVNRRDVLLHMEHVLFLVYALMFRLAQGREL